jgi:hypothetical protein
MSKKGWINKNGAKIKSLKSELVVWMVLNGKLIVLWDPLASNLKAQK